MQLRSSGDHRLLEDFPVGASEAGTEYDMVIVDEAHTVIAGVAVVRVRWAGDAADAAPPPPVAGPEWRHHIFLCRIVVGVWHNARVGAHGQNETGDADEELHVEAHGEQLAGGAVHPPQ